MRSVSCASRTARVLWAATALCPAGCSAAVAYTGQDVTKLKDAEQVRASFGAPADQGASADGGFEEFHTRRKISEPTVAGVNFILGAETLGLYELWSFPVTVVKTTWTTVFGQTLRFEYGLDGKVKDVLINGTSLDHRAGLP